jgi:hypothetical protein
MAKNKPKREFAEQVDLLETMLSSLAEFSDKRHIDVKGISKKRIMEKEKIKWD